ncbi:MAG: hypothetical protein WD472_05790 [Dehalococcoidia bacterium]
MSAMLRMWFVLLVGGAMALGVAACGGDDDGLDIGLPTDEATQPADGDDDADDGGTDEPAAFEETYPVNQTVWHQGFMIEVTGAVFAGTEPDIFGDQDITVTVEATFTNEGEDNWSLSSDVVLVTPDGPRNALLSDLAGVPGGLSVDGEFVFRVERDFDIETAYLLIGAGGEHRAQVPLGPDGGELVALEPSEPALSGAINLTMLDMTFTGASLRYDDPVNHSEADAGELLLTLYFDATSRRSGNWSLFAQDFTLATPDGSNLGADGALLPGLPGSDAGTDTKDLYVRFVVEEPAEGSYTLNWAGQDAWYAEGDPNPATFEFELE